MLLLAIGCRSAWELDEIIGDLTVPLPAQVVVGEVADGGLGMRVTRAGTRLVMAAPLAAEVRTRRGTDLHGPPGSFLGAGLATLDEDHVLVGAPGVGRVQDLLSGAVLATGEQLGGVIAARDGRWVASTHSGVRWDTGEVQVFGARPDSLAILTDGTLVAGFARGDTAVRIGDTAIPRAEAGSEAGYAVLVGDVLGDGTEVIAVGAPGLDRVDVYAPSGASLATFSPGLAGSTGSSAAERARFGASLARYAPGVLYVGAPMAHDAAGAIWRVEAGAPMEMLVGENPDDELGFSLWAGNGNVIVGAPGGPGTPGMVQVLTP